jgi:hypothetical protein
LNSTFAEKVRNKIPKCYIMVFNFREISPDW